MRRIWVRFGCFITGYSYGILQGCSEKSIRRVIRYTSAMLIMMILWSFIGYSFASRYLRASWEISFLGAAIMVFLVVQVERQVILSSTETKWPLIFRGVIAIAMAFIGSLIIDQIIFKEDIEQEKIVMMVDKVHEVFPSRAEELRKQIGEIDSTILQKEHERKALVDDISRNPKITIYENEIRNETNNLDSARKEVRVRSSSQIANPKMNLIAPLDDQIASLRVQKIKKDSMLLVLRPMVEAELRENVGFLDELELMISILFKSTAAMVVWIVWFVLLFGLECFILASKLSEPRNDYDAMVDQQTKLHLDRISLLGQRNRLESFSTHSET